MHAVHRAVTSFHVKDYSLDKKEKPTSLDGKERSMETENTNSSAAKNAARLAARHLCGAGCRHSS
ncbi:MAG: hypothetical protein V4591_07085, partial [Bdellovibrionota bacterium]